MNASVFSARAAAQRPQVSPEPCVYYWSLSVAWIGLLVLLSVRDAHQLSNHLVSLLPWVLTLAIVNLLPLSAGSAHLAADFPLTVAAALVLPPIESCLVAFIGSIDPPELRRTTALSKAVFNRSQASLSQYAAGMAAHALAHSPRTSPIILLLALIVILVQLASNYLLVAPVIAYRSRCTLIQAVQRLRIGSGPHFLLTLVTWAALGAMLAALYDQTKPWALVAFLAPILLCRQALVHDQQSINAMSAYKARETTILQISSQIHAERTDERRLIAADLHDEVLQPLFKVTLMGHVLKEDLASGKLLEMDQDLPELLSAAEMASGTLRDLIGDLRKSTLGRGGLAPALSSLIRALTEGCPFTIHPTIDPVHMEPAQELVAYQVAKEALGNAVKHSRAANIWVELHQDTHGVQLIVLDDGVGFDPLMDVEGHYGLHIMRERTASVGGQLYIDSLPGRGGSITLAIAKTDISARSGPT